MPPVLTVTFIFWPGLRFVIPTAALDPDGFGSTLTGRLVVTLKLFLAGTGFGVDAGFGFGMTFEGVAELPSTTVTLSFCPGIMLFTVTSVVDC